MDWLNTLWALIVRYWPAVFTVALPFVVNLIAKCSWSSDAKAWLAFGLSAAIGILAPFVAGVPFSPETIVPFSTAVFGGTTLAYLVFKRYKITCAWLDKLLEWGSTNPADEWGT